MMKLSALVAGTGLEPASASGGYEPAISRYIKQYLLRSK